MLNRNHCMAFRRLENGIVEFRDRPEMLYIPQDFHEDEEEEETTHVHYDPEDIASHFSHLPNFIPC